MKVFLSINKYFLSFLFTFSLLLSGCSEPKSKIENDRCSIKNINCIRSNQKLEFRTNRGTFIVELNAESAPLTSTSFLSLVERGSLNNTYFDRSIKNPFPFIVQGGHKENKIVLKNKINKLNVSYLDNENIALKPIPLEIKLKGEESPRYNQIISKDEDFRRIILTHKRGSLAMSRMQSLNSAKIKFYIALKDLPELDGRYAVFGKVLKGIDVVELIKEGDQILYIKKIGN